MATDVPDPLRPVIHDFKQALIATIENQLRCNASADADPQSIEIAIASPLHANQPEKPFQYQPMGPKPPENDSGTYGTDLQVAVKSVPGHAGLISIQLTFGIECGDDNILLLYRCSVSGWQRELLWQNPDLNSISDAFGSFFLFAIVASDSLHPYLVAVAHGTNWCTSNMSDFSVDLLAPSVAEKPQTRLAHLDQAYRREDDAILKVTSDGFQLRVTANSLSGDMVMRPGVFRYRTTNGKIERIQPIANNARDFVDEWLQIPWPEAAQWSAQPLPALKSVHDRFDYNLHPYTETSPGTPTIDDYGPVRACTSARGVFQVQIDLEPDKKSSHGNTLYARVQQSPTAFTMLSITPQPDPACTGPDIMKHRQ